MKKILKKYVKDLNGVQRIKDEAFKGAMLAKIRRSSDEEGANIVQKYKNYE